MTTKNKNLKGNLSTIIKILIMTIAPYIGAEQLTDPLTALTMSIIGFILAYIDAKYPNNLTILNNNNDEDDQQQKQ